MEKATELREIVRSTKLVPLRGEDFEKFFVETDDARGVNAAWMLRDYFDINKDEPKKVLFMGHRGSGKSTELYRFGEYLKDDFRIVNFSIRDEADTADLEYVDLIFIILQQLHEQAERDGLVVNEHILKNLDHYWNDQTLIENLKIAKAEVGAESEVKGGIWGLIRLKVKGVFKVGSETKTVVREHIKPRLTQLLQSANDLIFDITRQYRAMGKTPLLIIEDLDKLDLAIAETLFLRRKNILTAFNIHLIYTFPIFLHYSGKFSEIEAAFDHYELLSMIKVREKSGKPFETGRETIRKILEKRTELSLFAPDALDFVIEKCGGSLRHLFEILQNAVLDQRMRDREATILEKLAVENGFRKLRSYFERTITAEDLDTLKAVHHSADKKPTAEMKLKDMLNAMAVIEYNGDRWCAIHPAVEEMLRDKGELDVFVAE